MPWKSRRIKPSFPPFSQYRRGDVRLCDSGNLPQLLTYQPDKTREYMTKGIVEGAIILGDREIKKWPESSETVRRYLLNQ